MVLTCLGPASYGFGIRPGATALAGEVWEFRKP